MADARIPTIDIEAANDVSHLHPGTIIAVSGQGFEALSDVTIEIFGVPHKVTWPVDAEGGFSWGETLRPPLTGGVGVTVIAADGTRLEASADVFTATDAPPV